MDNKAQPTLWRKYCLWWARSHFLPQFLLAWMSSIMLSTILAGIPVIMNFLVTLVVVITILQIMERAVKEELKDALKEVEGSEEFAELKRILMEEAAKEIKKQESRDPDRRLTAVCHDCDNDIYSDDKLYTNGKGNCFCDVCWSLSNADA